MTENNELNKGVIDSATETEQKDKKIFEVLIHLENVSEENIEEIISILEKHIPCQYKMKGLWSRLVPESILELEKKLKQKEGEYWDEYGRC